MGQIFFIHSSVSGHLGYFHVLATVNNPNTGMHVCFHTVVLSRYMPRSRIAGSHGNSIASVKRPLAYISTQQTLTGSSGQMQCWPGGARAAHAICRLTTHPGAEVVGGWGQWHQLAGLLVWPQPLPRDLARNRGSPPCRVQAWLGCPWKSGLGPTQKLPFVTGHYVLVCTHRLLSHILCIYHQPSRYLPGL